MAVLAYQGVSIPAAALSTVNPSGTGAGADKVPANERGMLLVHNASGAGVTITIIVPGSKYGQALADAPTTVPAGAIRLIGPLVPELAATDGLIDLQASATTSVNYAAVAY